MPVTPPLFASRSQLLSIRARDSSERSTSSTFSANNDIPTEKKKDHTNNKNVQDVKTNDSTVSVSFHLESNSIHEVTARSELSRDQREQLWYTEENLKVIRSDARTVKGLMMRSGRFEEDDSEDDVCFRGIELDREKDVRFERQSRILMELFWCENRNYFETDIAGKLQEITQRAAEEAVIRGKQDRIAALKVYRRSQ